MMRSSTIVLAVGLPYGCLLSSAGEAALDPSGRLDGVSEVGAQGAPGSRQPARADALSLADGDVRRRAGAGADRVLAAGGGCLHDNGDTDGSNGYSNVTVEVLGARRTLLDDFVVPDGEVWRISDLHHVHVWNSSPPGSGIGMEIGLRADAGGAPGEPIAVLNIVQYDEQATGRTFFGRAEAQSSTDFESVDLAPGHYWFEATIVGPDNNFWLVTGDVQNNECWVNYDDAGGLQPGSVVFGVPADLSWCLTGEVVTDEPSLYEPGTSTRPYGEPRGCDTQDGWCEACLRCASPVVGEGDSVYGFSGEFFHSTIDLEIPGRCQHFRWARKYRSRVGPDTGQGNGWDSSYDIRIEPDGGDFILFDGNSRRDTYADQGDGTWTAPEFFRVLTEEGDGGYTLTFPDTGTWRFLPLDDLNAPGRISAIVDRNGNEITFTYLAAAECPQDLDGSGAVDFGDILEILTAWGNPGGPEDLDGSGLVDFGDILEVLTAWGPCPIGDPFIVITDDLGRDVEVAFDADGLVASVTDFTGRQVRYEYYQDGDEGGSAGDLKSHTSPVVVGTPTGNDFPDGKTTTYTYTTGFGDERLNHDLLTITDPKGQTYLANVYAHTIDAVDPRFTEDPGSIFFDRVVRQVYGDPGDIIDYFYLAVAPDESNNFATVRTIVNDRVGNVTEYSYDALNRLVIRREYTGRALDPDDVTTDVDNRPVNPLRLDDPEFFETRYTYNADALLTLTVFPNQNEETSLYDEANPERRAQGNLLESCRLPGPLGGDQPDICELFEYDDGFGGCCGTSFVTRHVDARGNETLHEYDDFGNRLHTQHRIPSIVEDWEYNGFGQTTAHVLPDNGSAHRRRDEYTYYADGPQEGYQQESIVDAPGFALTTTFEYDDVGNLVRVIDPGSHDTILVVNELNQVVRELSAEVDLPNGPARYERDTYYDANDNVVRHDVQNVDDQGDLQDNTHFTTVYEYEILNRRVRTCAESGAYNGAIPGPPELPTCDGLPDGEFVRTEYEYDANRNRTLVRDGEAAEGRQPANEVATVYDERDLVFREIRAPGDPDQSSDQFDYDGNRNVIRLTEGLEADPHVYLRRYDGYDRQWGRDDGGPNDEAAADSMGNATFYHYDENGNMVGGRLEGELVDVPGDAGNLRLYETTYVYDAMDRRTREDVAFFDTETQLPIGDGLATTEVEYSDSSQMVRVVDDNLHETLTAYDTANRVLTVTDAKGSTTANEYDADSRRIALTEVEKSDLGGDDEVFVTSYAYDSIDRVVRVTDNIGNVNRFGYDSRDNRTVVHDALDHETRYTYDGLDRRYNTIIDLDGDGADGDGPDITNDQAWDDSSRLTSRTDDNGNVTGYEYDPLNRLARVDYADCTQSQTGYDVHDSVVLTVDPIGSVTEYEYDGLDRVVRKDVVPGPSVSPDTTFELYAYDGLSRLVSAEDDDAQVTRGYDSRSETTRETLNGQVTTYEYDGVGNRLVSTYPGGRTVASTYDELDRRQNVSGGGGPIADFAYVGPGRVTRRNYGNGTRMDRVYDGVKRVVGTLHARIGDGLVLDERVYDWDPVYNKTGRRDQRPGGPQLTHQYEYDDAYRLVRTVVLDANELPICERQYLLDGVGNRELVQGCTDPGPYFMDPTLCEPADFQMNQYTVTPTPANQRQYDLNGNLIRIIDEAPPPLATITYDYRNRMTDYEDPSAGLVSRYSYDPLGRRIGRIVNGNETRYFYEAGRVCEEQDGFGATRATYVWGQSRYELLTMQRDGIDLYFHGDDLFNVMLLTDGAGQPVERFEYGDYGQPVDPFTVNPVPGDPSGVGNPYLFGSRRYDPETGWYWFDGRYLDPRAGRFTTRDPRESFLYDGVHLDTLGIWADTAALGNAYIAGLNNLWTLLTQCTTPARTEEECCDDAKKAGLDNGDEGGVICCDGVMVVCVWGSWKPAKADEIIRKCIKKHEEDHKDDVECKKTDKLTRPPWKKGKVPKDEECSAYTVEVDCYKANAGGCGKDDDCKKAVKKEQDFAKKQKKKYCKP